MPKSKFEARLIDNRLNKLKKTSAMNLLSRDNDIF